MRPRATASTPWRDDTDDEGRVIRNDLGKLPHASLAQAILYQAMKDWQRYGHMTGLFMDTVANTRDLTRDKTRIDGVALAYGFTCPQDELLAFFQSPVLGVYCALAGVSAADVMDFVLSAV